MIKNIITTSVAMILIIQNVSFAIPYISEEKALIIASGLTNDLGKATYCSNETDKFKIYFDKKDKEIIYWITVDLIQLKDIPTIQSIEWYSPDGKIWLKETRDSLRMSASSALGAKSLKKDAAFILKTKDIPDDLNGIWAIRFIWNDNIIDERYFSFANGNPTIDDAQIKKLKEKITEYNMGISDSNNDTIFKLSSYLCDDYKEPYHKQKIIKPRISFHPNDEIKYILNIDPSYLIGFTDILVFLFSPDGKIQKKYHVIPYEPKTYFGACETAKPYRSSAFIDQKIDFKEILKNIDGSNKNLGLWQLYVLYLNADMIMDGRYFYLDTNERTLIDPEDIKNIDYKARRAAMLDMLNKEEQGTIKERINSVENERLKNAKKIKVGMLKNELIALAGAPDSVDVNSYDDAEIMTYFKIRNDIVGTDFTSKVISRYASIPHAKKIQVIIKHDHVVGIRVITKVPIFEE